jgi:protein-disulfide isomerase
MLFFGLDLLQNTNPSTQVYDFEGITRPIAYSETPVQGGKNAKLAIYEFGDFTCPVCKSIQPFMTQIMSLYSEDVVRVWKDFPVRSELSEQTAIAARCSHEQDNFWLYKGWIFSNQDALSQSLFVAAANELGLDADKFAKCLGDPDIKDIVNRDFQEGLALGVNSTPTLVIGDVALTEVSSFEELESLVLQELSKIGDKK